MSSILVLYDSATGNTAVMACYVGEGAATVPRIEVRLRPVEEASREDGLWCDGMAVGTPTNLGLICWNSENRLGRSPDRAGHGLRPARASIQIRLELEKRD